MITLLVSGGFEHLSGANILIDYCSDQTLMMSDLASELVRLFCFQSRQTGVNTIVMLDQQGGTYVNTTDWSHLQTIVLGLMSYFSQTIFWSFESFAFILEEGQVIFTRCNSSLFFRSLHTHIFLAAASTQLLLFNL